jgi:hypothetical protein
MFRGPTVSEVERMVRLQRGIKEDGAHYFEEIQIISRHYLHFASVLWKGRAAIMLITQRSSQLDEGWRRVREYIPRVEAILGPVD